MLRELQSSGASLYLDIKTDRVVPPLMRVLHEAIASGGWAPSRLLIASFNQHHIGIEVRACTDCKVDADPTRLSDRPTNRPRF